MINNEFVQVYVTVIEKLEKVIKVNVDATGLTNKDINDVALEMASDAYNNSEIILEADDFTYSDFSISSQEEIENYKDKKIQEIV